MPLSPLPACVLLKVTPSVSGKSKGLNTLCKLKLQPLFYMVPTPINRPCLSQGFPNLDMNPINNINGCLQLRDLGHFLCHLLDPREPCYSLGTPGAVQGPLSPGQQNSAHFPVWVWVQSWERLQFSRAVPIVPITCPESQGISPEKTPGWSPQCPPGDVPRGVVRSSNSGICLESSAPVEH